MQGVHSTSRPKCSSCDAVLVPGSLFCDVCGASQSNIQVARKLRNSSFDTVKEAKGGILSAGEVLKHRRHQYLIEEAIARSGFGATFRATDLRSKKQVLIKQMLEQPAYDSFKKQLVESFKREAKFIRRIKHPAFPRGHHYFEKNRSFFLIMEFINGKELSKAIEDYKAEKGKIPDGLLVYLGIEIAEALEIIHSQGYIYRDLKPQNVMLDGLSSKVKMIDFGTLYHRKDKEPLIFESKGYTPPEFLESQKPFEASGDIFSLGVLLYEAAEGDIPEVGFQWSSKNSKRNPKLVEIIEKCIAKDPAQRFQKARQVSKELHKLTRKGLWPFRNKDSVSIVEISVLPKTLYPSASTYCEFCGFSDPASQIGYCKKCRVALKVGQLKWTTEKKEKEFFLYSDESIVGKSKECHLSLEETKDQPGTLAARHAKFTRQGTSFWVESLDLSSPVKVNGRKVKGPIELFDADSLSVGNLILVFSLLDAC